MYRKPPLVFCVLALLTLAGCSVKEKRCDCPCWLMLELGEIDSARFKSVEIDVFSDGGFLHSESVGCDRFGKTYVVEVPRKSVRVNVRAGDEGLFQADRGVVIPFGEPCPPLWQYTSFLDTSTESRRDTVRLHKNYSLLTVEMVTMGEPFPFGIGIEGDACGYGPDGNVLKGDFSVGCDPDENGLCSVRLPRQTESSLMLSILDSGTSVREFAIGEYIAASGFDWTSPDLGDLNITVNFALTRIHLEIDDWKTAFEYDVEI